MSHFLIFISVAFREAGLFTFLMSKDTWLHHHFSFVLEQHMGPNIVASHSSWKEITLFFI